MTRISDDDVRAGYLRQHGRPMKDADLNAWFEICQMFEVIPVGTYEEIEKARDRAIDRDLGHLRRA